MEGNDIYPIGQQDFKIGVNFSSEQRRIENWKIEY